MRSISAMILGMLISTSLNAKDFSTDYAHVPLVIMPSINMKTIQAEDQMDKLRGEAPRFAYTHKVNLNPSNSGIWDVDGNLSIWRLRISSRAAESINLGFTKYDMPTSASLYVFSNDGESIRGPFNAMNNNAAKQLWTPVVFGEQIIVELRVATNEREQVKLQLSEVNHDYLGFGKPKMVMEKSGSCNVDVVCNQGNAYSQQIRSVATISMNGRRFCTGSMINNTANDGKPYFLTANHCGVRSNNAATLVAYWNFENTTCRAPNSNASGDRGDGKLTQFTTGATFRAAIANSDFTLVEFNQKPDPAFKVFYAGWDRRKIISTTSFGIHHPNVDEKRISFDYDPSTITTYMDRNQSGVDTHLRISSWNVGTTEPGSSGSPLFNQDKRIIGQLHGGYASCTDLRGDWYGSLAYSWNTGGNATNSLKPWLDASNTGAEFIDGVEQQ